MTAFSADDLFAHSDALRRLARDLVADEALADDAVQQAYVVALTRPPRERSSLAGWLRTVVRSCSLDLLRQQGRRRRREQQVDAPKPLAPDEAAARLELQAAIAAAVRGLGEPYGSVVWLRWFEGLSPSEIAARQGEPVKTIKTRLGRALQLLRSKLDGRPGGRDAWLAALAPLAQIPVARTGASAVAAGGGAGVLLLPKLLGVLLFASLLLGGGLWFWRSGIAPTDAARSAGSAVAALAGEVRGGEGALPSAGSPSGSSDAAAKEAEAVALYRREAVPLAAGGPSVQLLVRGVDGAPLADVDVFYGVPAAVSAAAAATAQSDAEQWRRLHRDVVGLYARFGERSRTDGAGIARWPWSGREGNAGFWLCVVQRGGDYGELWVSRSLTPETVHELQLQPDRNFTVRVLDAQQRPVAGIPVAATFASRETAGHRLREDFGPTDDSGQVEARHVQIWCERIEPRGASLPAAVEIDLPGIHEAQQIDANAVPDQPLVLTLPPCGGLRITVRDEVGAPVAGERWLLREHEGASDRPFGATTDAAGIAEFPRVALGRSWQVGRDRIPESPRIVIGPRAPGERVDVHQQQDPVPVLAGRLLQQGEPLAVTRITITAIASGRELSSLRGTTDGDGRFTMPARADWLEQRLQELRIHPYSAEEGHAGTCAIWRGERELTAGTHELGTLVLEPEPIVVAGQLVVAEGVPLPPELQLSVEAATEAMSDAWRHVSLRRRLRPDGAFALSGSVPNGPLRLVVTTANRFVPVPTQRFRAGDQGLQIELHRGGSVRASVTAENQIAMFCQVPLLVPMDQDSSLSGFMSFNPQLDPRMARESGIVGDAPLETEFVWPAVAPGRYRLEIWSRGLHRPLHVVPDVVVVDGQRNEEARLQRIAVPGMRSIVLKLPQADRALRQPPSHGVGVIAVLDGERPAELCWQVDGSMAMFATVQPLDVLVRLNGFRDRIVRGVVADQTIELEPGIPVRLRAEGYPVPAGHTLQLELTAIDDVLAQPQLYSAAAGGSIPGYQRMSMTADCAAGVASLQLPAPGRHRVTASLRAASGAASALLVEPAELVIGADGGTFELRIRGTR